jgi:ubiquinone/menaquinone biosynthesis C-methylase UbiE
MMKTKEVSQKDIQNWFNGTYSRFGLNYLRPVEAYILFLELLKAEPGKKILDVACGPGQLLTAASAYQLELYGVDISDVAVDLCRQRLKNAQVLTGNAEQLPFEDKLFDYITCLGSIERFLDRKNALQEQYRVGKEGATYCFLVRNKNHFKWKVFKQVLGLKNKKGHQDALGLSEWRELFASVGFKELLVLPDHWPVMKWSHYFLKPVGWKVDYTKAPGVDESLDNANEYIFLLQK